MNTRVTKSFQFHAAHQLPHHAGKCRGLHGHTYRVDLTFEGTPAPVDPTKPSTDEGMLIDFDDIKSAWAPFDEKLDHKFLNDIIDVPTAERIARFIFDGLRARSFPRAVQLASVRVWETPTSSAEVTL